MHPGWQVDDIQHLIFPLLESRDLARLAQTCEALFDLATDELWRTITSISPFVCWLPPDFRSRPLGLEDVHRIDLYARKVQNLVLEPEGANKVLRLPLLFKINPTPQSNYEWAKIWKEIATLRPPTEFLLNLRRIRISNVAEEILLPLVGISGSNLTKIYIKYIHHPLPERVVVRFLEQLQDTPKLEFLFLRDGEDLVPSKLIQNAPLKHLRLDPRIQAHGHAEFHFKELSLRTEILQKSMLERLTVGLSTEWYSPEIEIVASTGKHLPQLKELWLNLSTFRPEGRSWVSDNTNRQRSSAASLLPQLKELWQNLTTFRAEGQNWDLDSSDRRRSPAVFFEGLDSPELSVLNVKFPIDVTGPMVSEVVSAAKAHCRLDNLTDLALSGAGWFSMCDECGSRPEPRTTALELRAALDILLPLPRLKALRLSVAPNFLGALDLDLYKSVTDGLPALERLWLGHADFATSCTSGVKYYERVPLHHLAAFCCMLPSLVDVSMGCMDGMTLEETPRAEWTCPGVKRLAVQRWAGRGASRDLLHLGLRTYFPGSDLARKDFDPRMYLF